MQCYLKRGGGRLCSVVGCHNNQKKLVKWRESVCAIHNPLLGKDCPCLEPYRFHYFPSDQDKRSSWIKSLNKKDFKPSRDSVVCSTHFIDGQPTIENPSPQLLLGYNKKVTAGRIRKQRKYVPHPQPQVIEDPFTALHEDKMDIAGTDKDVIQCDCLCHKCDCCINAAQHTEATFPGLKDHDYCKLPSTESEEQPRPPNNISTQTEKVIDLAGSLNEKDCIFYTGLTLTVFQCLVSALIPLSTRTFHLKISDQIFLVLMRLRLALTVTDLGKRFFISRTTVCAIFRLWIEIMSINMSKLIMWLPRETIIATMPSDFKEFYPKTTCIVDCSEIFTERPINLTARSCTWSTYKSHNTLKFLICIAPNGYIMFISPFYGGRASDKFICTDSGFLKFLLPGDEVMADRGVLISDELAMLRVALNVPPFLLGRSQMTEQETTDTRRCARVRIHVERAIARLKTYKILKSIIPPTLRKQINCILCVCAALCNLKPELIRRTDENK